MRSVVRSAALAITAVFVLFSAVNASATTRNAADYPLRLHVYTTNWSHDRYLVDYDSIGYGYHGYGRANLQDGNNINAIDYTFDCEDHFLKSDSGEAYPARWKKNTAKSQQIEILVGIIGSNHVDTCELKVTLKDYVYHRVNGKMVTLTQQQYKERESNEAARSVALAPEDTDISHYPLKLSLLDVNWHARTGGMYSGLGHGNLIAEHGPRAVDIAFSCPVRIDVTPEGRFYHGKWSADGAQMDLLLKKIGDPNSSATCSLKTVLHDDVYVLQSAGVLKAVPAEQYKSTPTAP